MKILLIGTSDRRGGAAIASFRLFLALKKHFKNVEMLVRNKFSTEEGVIGLDNTIFQKKLNILRFLTERILFILYMKSKELLFFFSPANTGQNISNIKQVKNADILHLHWINQGFLSIKDLDTLFKSGKKIVWTMHDMWPFTGGCHYSGECENYFFECGRCPFLRTNKKNDLSNRVFKDKEKIYKNAQITLIAPSNWLAEKARKSHLLKNFRIHILPNPVDTEVYIPAERSEIRKTLSLPDDKFLILAGSANLMEKRKGFIFLVKALERMKEEDPDITKNFGLITFGKSSNVKDLPVQIYPQPYLGDDNSIVKLYQSADVFVLPTLQDNLPVTITESLACGTPVVAFNTGGIPDIIEHKISGYIADYKDIDDLIAGLKWVRNNIEIQKIKEECRKRIIENYSYKIIAEKHMILYNDLINN